MKPQVIHGGVAGTAILLLASLALLAPIGSSSSHREAPNICKNPKVDGTDFYMFRSLQSGHADTVTLVACYIPLQDGYGGPNYFTMDPNALYEIHIDNNADAKEDITFQFRFNTSLQDFQLPVGPTGNTSNVSIPIVQNGAITVGDNSHLNVRESYTVKVVTGDRRTGVVQDVLDADTNASTFEKPVDYIGEKTIPDYPAYAAAHVFNIKLPGAGNFTGRMFVGQRKDPFVVSLGPTFDLLNLNPLGSENVKGADILSDKNVTAICLEVPIAYLRANDPVIGGWTTASLRQARVINPEPLSAVANKVTVEGGAWTRVSRLGAPLVNELVIGLKDKDRFNASEPKDDAQFATYVTNPTLPALIQLLFPSVTAPTSFPRTDLVAVFLTGIQGVNQATSATPVAAEILRLNTDTPVAETQNRLGVIGGDLAGYPNGRRPGDDVVDIALRAVMGKVILVLNPESTDAPSGNLAFTDGAFIDSTFFDATFPYLKTPIPGAVNPVK